MEHLQHFGLKQEAFGNEPDLRFYMDSPSHTDARRRVERGLRQSKGLTVLTGDPGTGKTLLARRLFEDLEEEIFEASLMVMLPGAVDADMVLGRFARELGVEEPGKDRSTLLAQLYERLAIVREDGRHALLIMDDAHVLGRETMAEIGGLLNLEYEDRRLLSLLLVGLPDLDSVLSGDSSLHQRVDVRVRLMPLDLDGTRAYIAHRLTRVGGRLDLLPEETIETIAKFSRGRPRLINTLADNALFEAFLGDRCRAEPSDVERAAADLGIGTDPGTTYTQAVASPRAARSDSAPSRPHVAPMVSMAEFEAVQPQQATPIGPAADGGPEDLDTLLDSCVGSPDELTTLLECDEVGSGATIELDAEVESMLVDVEEVSEASSLPSFGGQNDGAGTMAEETRIALPEEESSPRDAGESEIDDLFVELLDD